MKNKQNTNSFAGYKYLLFVPLAFALVTMNNTTIRANVQKKVVKTTKTTKKAGANDKVYVVVEQMPSFPGGDSALLKYLFENVKYPVSALKAQKQGRVMVCFTVEKDGAISNVKVARSVTPSLDAEAVRAIKSMPKWSPGKQGGEFVRVKYIVPVTFRLK
ncbi:energy transducer TonB [Hoylesella loescheii]|uniref:energy transducer TonB n=1 Tax=Hoylesella loescheii TaxID=840 RepID=UPI0028E368C9|nr:energy transducer TonB [Hoylesella loescheii]